jgi:hypothetical protein
VDEGVAVRRGIRGAIGLVAALAAVAIATPGLPTSPASAGASDYKLAYQTLPDGRKAVARWNPCQTIVYRVNPTYLSSNSTTRAKAIAEVKEAFKRASAATGITFKYAGTSTQIPKNTSSNRWHERMSSAEIVVAWVNQTKSDAKTNLLGRTSSGAYSAGTGGYAYKYWRSGSDPWRGVTGRGFVVLDARQNSKFAPGFGSGATRGSLLLHEIGHALGLLHVGATSQTMYPTVLKRSSTGYYSGDATGLKKLGRTSGCITTPTWVWKNVS